MSTGAIVGLWFFGLFGWIILMTVFLSMGIRHGSLRVANGKTGPAFRKRTSNRIGGAMLGIWIAGGVTLQYGQGLMYAVQRHQPIAQWAYFALLIGVLMGGGFGGLMLYLAGPRDLYLNLDRRTYRFVSGWPFCPHEQARPWEDMAGIYVRSCGGGSRGVRNYFVEVAWRQKRGSCPQLGHFGSEGKANALAEEMAAVLGVPRIAPPPPGQTWAVPGSLTVLTKSEARPYRRFRPTLFSAPDVSPSEEDTKQPSA